MKRSERLALLYGEDDITVRMARRNEGVLAAQAAGAAMGIVLLVSVLVVYLLK